MTSRTVTRGQVIRSFVSGGRVYADIQMLDGETRSRVEVLQPFGVTAVPTPGADLVVLEVGSRDHLVAQIGDSRSLRVDEAQPGEIAVRHGSGQTVIFTDEGIRVSGALKIEIESAGEVTVTAPLVKIDGDAEVTGTLTVDGIVINTHHHTGVETGGGVTGGPAS